MKKRIIAMLVLVLMLLPISLSSCNKETVIEETAAKVYTLYTICGESTTQDAIREVELALNRLTFYQLGVCIKLVMVPEDQYDALIADKFQEIDDYEALQAKLKEESKNTSAADSEAADSEAADSSTESTVDNSKIITGDEYIEMLKRGEEYVYDAPRLDIFLVRGFDNYISYVGDSMLADLSDKLLSEAKLINDKIYPTILNAAKVVTKKGTKKTYGIPMNTVIGEYEYVVFDKELLNKYEIDAKTMNTLEDLEYYLRIIKENEPDVVPLANAFDSTYCSYLFADGFPASVTADGVVVNPYDDVTTLDYYTLISRYRTLGYLNDQDNGKRFAVKFVKGTFEDLEALEKETGRTYVSAIHSYPVPTNENTCANLFCVSKYVVANELTDVAELLALIETSTEVANILTFGIENENYSLDDNGQVVRLNNDYITEPRYTGNTFLTYTLAGENPDKWELFKQQNLDSSKSADQTKSLGFAYYPNTFTDPDDKEKTFAEPNYVDIITPLAEEAYKSIIDGTAGVLNYDELAARAKDTVNAALIKQVEDKYTEEYTSELYRQIETNINNDTAYYEEQKKLAYKQAIDKFKTTSFKNTAKRKLRTQVTEELGSGATASQITDRVNELFTDEYLTQCVIEKISAEEIESSQNSLITNTINKKIKEEKAALLVSNSYISGLAAILGSSEVVAEKEALLGADNYYLYQDEFSKYIREKIVAYCNDLISKLSDTVEVKYNAFIDEMIAQYDYNDEAKRSLTIYNTALSNLAKDEDTLKAIRKQCTAEVKASMPEGTKSEDIDVEVEATMTDTYIRAKIIEMKLVTDKQIKDEYNKVLSNLVNKAVGFFKVESDEATDSSDASDVTSGTASTETSDTGDGTNPEEPGEDGKINYFALVFEKRIQAQYYVYAPLPTA